MDETKRCIDCGLKKPLETLTRSGKYLRSYCRRCSNDRSRKYGVENRERRTLPRQRLQTPALA